MKNAIRLLLGAMSKKQARNLITVLIKKYNLEFDKKTFNLSVSDLKLYNNYERIYKVAYEKNTLEIYLNHGSAMFIHKDYISIYTL